MSLTIEQCELRDANDFVEKHHRHHKPVVGHRFSIRVAADGETVGVIIVGRPVARAVPSHEVLEVTRCCTDGTKNASSALYGAAARAGKALGYHRIQTYTLPEEGGVSMRAVGWEFDGETAGGHWKRSEPNAKPRRTDQPQGVKHRWVKELR